MFAADTKFEECRGNLNSLNLEFEAFDKITSVVLKAERRKNEESLYCIKLKEKKDSLEISLKDVKNKYETLKAKLPQCLERNEFLVCNLANSQNNTKLLRNIRLDLEHYVLVKEEAMQNEIITKKNIIDEYKNKVLEQLEEYEHHPLAVARQKLNTSIKKMQVEILLYEKKNAEENEKKCRLKKIRIRLSQTKIINFVEEIKNQKYKKQEYLNVAEKNKHLVEQTKKLVIKLSKLKLNAENEKKTLNESYNLNVRVSEKNEQLKNLHMQLKQKEKLTSNYSFSNFWFNYKNVSLTKTREENLNNNNNSIDEAGDNVLSNVSSASQNIFNMLTKKRSANNNINKESYQELCDQTNLSFSLPKNNNQSHGSKFEDETQPPKKVQILDVQNVNVNNWEGIQLPDPHSNIPNIKLYENDTSEEVVYNNILIEANPNAVINDSAHLSENIDKNKVNLENTSVYSAEIREHIITEINSPETCVTSEEIITSGETFTCVNKSSNFSTQNSNTFISEVVKLQESHEVDNMSNNNQYNLSIQIQANENNLNTNEQVQNMNNSKNEPLGLFNNNLVSPFFMLNKTESNNSPENVIKKQLTSVTSSKIENKSFNMQNFNDCNGVPNINNNAQTHISTLSINNDCIKNVNANYEKSPQENLITNNEQNSKISNEYLDQYDDRFKKYDKQIADSSFILSPINVSSNESNFKQDQPEQSASFINNFSFQNNEQDGSRPFSSNFDTINNETNKKSDGPAFIFGGNTVANSFFSMFGD